MEKETLLKIVLTILVAVSGFLHYTLYKQNQDFDPHDTTAATVLIMNGKRRVLGTGFFITANGQILTAAHVIHGVKTILVRSRDSSRLYEAQVMGELLSMDLAVLKASSIVSTKRYLKIRKGPDVKVGTKIYVIGHPLGIRWVFNEGVVSRKGFHLVGVFNSFKTTTRFFYYVNAPIMAGNSGGPVVDKNGNVVCMITNSLIAPGVPRNTPAHLNLCTPSYDIIRFLEGM